MFSSSGNIFFRCISSNYLRRFAFNSPIFNNVKLSTSPSVLRNTLRVNVRHFSITNNSKEDQWVNITFITMDDGTSIARKARVGQKLQDYMNGKEFQDRSIGICGGTVSCSTCHVVLSVEDFDKAGEPDVDEEDLLCYAPDRSDYSRLGCCVTVAPWMEGLVVKIPLMVKDHRDQNS